MAHTKFSDRELDGTGGYPEAHDFESTPDAGAKGTGSATDQGILEAEAAAAMRDFEDTRKGN
jgi:hypothetical protein